MAKKDEEQYTQLQEKKQSEAVQDLYATYVHPTKTFYQTAPKRCFQRKDPISILRQREYGLINFHRYSDARHQLMDRSLPNKGEIVGAMSRPTFCGQFSEDGQRFFSACQDYRIRLFDTSSLHTFQKLSTIEAADVGWAILDTAISPDRNSLAYSTWSDCLYLIKLNEDQDRPNISALHLNPQSLSFSIFSLQYSNDGTEIIGGSNDTCVYVYDLVKQQRTLRVRAHQDDINAVRFVDNSNSLIVSGSDDNFVSIWDRRALNESSPKPVGIFAGHTLGITFVHSRMDTRYLISNSKDQSIKLWDMRRFSDETTIRKIQSIADNMNPGWDYRYESYGRRPEKCHIVGDPSVRTYRGHSVSYTLIRCYFSPSFTTGQKYIVTGSSDGSIRIYDVLTGDVKLTLRVSSSYGQGREQCVRDVSWHPYENYLISTSWDSNRAHVRWIYSPVDSSDSEETSSVTEGEIALADEDYSPVMNHRPNLRQLLIQQFLGHTATDSDDDSYTEEP